MWIVGAGPRACPHRKGTAKTPRTPTMSRQLVTRLHVARQEADVDCRGRPPRLPAQEGDRQDAKRGGEASPAPRGLET
jgi:hypothetical protein